MVQIEELSKVILQIIVNRNAGATRRIPEMIQSVYSSLKLDSHSLMTIPSDKLRSRLDQDDSCGIQRLDIAVKALIEESYLYPSEQQQAMLRKAEELLLYLQANDSTFSLERIALLNDIKQLQIPDSLL